MLIINPRNDGEGAYEAELHIKIPPEADYTGVERNSKVNENQLFYLMYMLKKKKQLQC